MDKDTKQRILNKFNDAHKEAQLDKIVELCERLDREFDPEILLTLLITIGMEVVQNLLPVTGEDGIKRMLLELFRRCVAEAALSNPEFRDLLSEEVLFSVKRSFEGAAKKPQHREKVAPEKGFNQMQTALKKSGLVN